MHSERAHGTTGCLPQRVGWRESMGPRRKGAEAFLRELSLWSWGGQWEPCKRGSWDHGILGLREALVPTLCIQALSYNRPFLEGGRE